VLLAAAAIVAATLLSEALRDLVAGARVRELTSALEASNDLQATLREATHDPSLVVAYALADGLLTTQDGTASSSPASHQISTPVHSDSGIVAWILHSHRRDVERLDAALNGSARLAFEVERLRATAAVQSQHLADSRARIIEAGNVERRRLERDVHDGAQQFVLSLGMQLEVALLDIDADAPQRAPLELGLAQVRIALDDLRAIAHGLRPSPLGVAGLDATLHALARRSDFAVTVGPIPRRRFGASTDSAIVAFVQAALGTAGGPVDIGISDHAASIDVTISGVATGEVAAVTEDHLAAIGGWLVSHANTVTAVIPCAS
jgi:signal transduction histidine kinase